MECTILLNKNRNLAFLGSGRINIILRKHISRGRGKCAQCHSLIVSGNGHALGAARHLFTGGHIYKLDSDLHHFRFRLIRCILGGPGDGSFAYTTEKPTHTLVREVFSIERIDLLINSGCPIDKVLAFRGSYFGDIIRRSGLVSKKHKLPVGIFIPLSPSSIAIIKDHRDGINGLLIVGHIVVVFILGPDSVDRNVGICEGHIALQKCHIGRFLLCRIAGSMAILSLRPSQEDNPVVLGAKRSTTLQSGRIAGIVLVRIGNSTSRAIGIVEQCVRFLLVVRDLVAVVIDRIVHIKDLLIRVPDEILAGLRAIQHIGVSGIIASKPIGGLVADRLIADFLSSPRIHRTRLNYNSLRIYPEVVDGVAVLCLNGRNEGTLCHVDGCN